MGGGLVSPTQNPNQRAKRYIEIMLFRIKHFAKLVTETRNWETPLEIPGTHGLGEKMTKKPSRGDRTLFQEEREVTKGGVKDGTY